MVEHPAVLKGSSNYLLEIRQLWLLVIGVYDHIVNVKIAHYGWIKPATTIVAMICWR